MNHFDLVVVGAGIMGVTAALRAADGGMRVLVLEQDSAGSRASGVNAGTLSLQIKRVSLMRYALAGYAWWKDAGDAVGFKRTGSYTLAFNASEEALLDERMRLKIAAGAPIEFVSPATVRAAESALCDRIVSATYCADDGHADSTRTGVYLRALLHEAGIELRERSALLGIDVGGVGYTLHTAHENVTSTNLLLATGAWLKPTAALLGADLPIEVRVNTVTATERGPSLLGAGVGHATGLLTLKQKSNGSFLIGGGWQGRGSPETGRGEVVGETLLQNLRLARFAVPGIVGFRILRSWTGFEAFVPDHYPLAGELPGIPRAYVLGCVRGGYTIGPCIGTLMGDRILGREPALPLFDPVRVMKPQIAMRENIDSPLRTRSPTLPVA